MNKKMVMIVDDDREFLEELKETLELSGYELVAVSDPDMAVEQAKRTKPGVILLDLKMPKKNGFQLANELKYFLEISPVSVIAISAYYKDEYKPLLDLCGIKRYLKKPFQPLNVIAEIEDALAEIRKKYPELVDQE